MEESTLLGAKIEITEAQSKLSHPLLHSLPVASHGTNAGLSASDQDAKTLRGHDHDAGLAAGRPRNGSPLDVVLEAAAFSLTSVRAEHFTMEFSAFFSVLVELCDWASMLSSHYFCTLSTRNACNTPTAPSASCSGGTGNRAEVAHSLLTPEEVHT